jgi:hypothetical protein
MAALTNGVSSFRFSTYVLVTKMVIFNNCNGLFIEFYGISAAYLFVASGKFDKAFSGLIPIYKQNAVRFI